TSNQDDQTEACGMRNEDRTECSSFCFRIIVKAVCADGSLSPLPLEGITVTSKLPEFAVQCAGSFPSTMQPGDMAMCDIKNVKLCDDFTDVVTVFGHAVGNASIFTHPPTSITNDSVTVHIKPIAVSCKSTLTSSLDADNNPDDNCVTLPMGTTGAPLTLTTIISNDSDVTLDVTVGNLPPLVSCVDDTTPVVVTQPITIGPRGTATITGCYLSDCVNTNFPIYVRGTVNTSITNENCACFYGPNGKPITTSSNAN